MDTRRDEKPPAFGEGGSLTFVDRFGTWLSARRVRREAPTLRGARISDIGCGFEARLARSFRGEATHVTVLDVALAEDLKSYPGVTAIEGLLPEALAEIPVGTQDVILCLSVLEHLWEPTETLVALRERLAPGGVLLLNVPSWRGKRFLELSAFRLGLSPAESIDDHKEYFDPVDLWPLLVRAGFVPSEIRCFRHKFGLNTFAVCGRSRLRA